LLDDDGRGNEDIAVRATVTIKGSDIEVDLSESDLQVESFINSSFANTQSAVVMSFAFLLDPGIAQNSGTIRPLTVKMREGTVVWALPGAPVTLCTSHCSQEIIEAIVSAIAPACPERAMAGWGKRFRIAIKGDDPRNGKPFIWHMFHARPGAGASSGGDGWHGSGEWHSAGGLKFGSVEVAEARFPLYFERHEYRENSGGDGQYVGGSGCELLLHLETDEDCVVNTAGEGTTHAAAGRQGGKDGATHKYRILKPDGGVRVLKTKEEGILVEARSVFDVRSGGGGGWGAPSDRDTDARSIDSREELLPLASGG
jgi:N-methylhydantoinase B